ncbi:hypothetical protein QOT17_021791 [Balamuthia mandrillaris]
MSDDDKHSTQHWDDLSPVELPLLIEKEQASIQHLKVTQDDLLESLGKHQTVNEDETFAIIPLSYNTYPYLSLSFPAHNKLVSVGLIPHRPYHKIVNLCSSMWNMALAKYILGSKTASNWVQNRDILLHFQDNSNACWLESQCYSVGFSVPMDLLHFQASSPFMPLQILFFHPMVVLWSVSFPFDKGGTSILLHHKELLDSLDTTGSALLPPFSPIGAALNVVVEVGQNLNNLVWAMPIALQLTGAILSSRCHKEHDLCAEGKAGAADLPVVEELAMGTSLMDLFYNTGSCHFQPLYHVMAAIPN